MASHHPIRKIVLPEIPDKLYFRIGDVARLCEVPAYVLRFWETEFPQLKPNKGGTGQRLYRKRDVEMALRIKSLLYDQGYTIPGARQVFKSEARAKDITPAAAAEPAASAVPRSAELAAAPARAATAADARETELQTQLQAKLHAVRDELRVLIQALAAPIGTLPLERPLPFSSGPKGPKLQALRPRLVSAAGESTGPRLTTLPRASARESLRVAGADAAQDAQPGLFPAFLTSPPSPSE